MTNRTKQKKYWKKALPLFTWIFLFGNCALYCQNCSTVDNLQMNINNNATSNDHSIKLTWTPINGVSQYEIQTSLDGSNFGDTNTTTSNSYVFNSPSTPNTAYWFRVRMTNSENNCDWTTSAAFYTSAALPSAVIATYSESGIQFEIPDEIPINNPENTKYAVYSTTNNNYVQASGNFEITPYFATKNDWQSIVLNNITENTTYCFKSLVMNEDSNIRKAIGEDILPTESFNSNNLTQGSSASTSAWFAPSSNSPIGWIANGNCSGGAIGFSGNWNNFWGNFIRLPKQDCSGFDSITTTFTLSHSYSPNTTNNYFRFYIWADNAYKQIVSQVTINHTPITTNTYGTFYFNEERTCANIEVTFDLATINNKSDVLIYLEANSAYNNSAPFWFYLDEIKVNNAQGETTCISTTLGVDSFDSVASVYPNPVSDTITVQTQENIISMSLFNILGQKVVEKEGVNSLTTENLPIGNYVLKVVLDNGTITTHKIIKK